MTLFEELQNTSSEEDVKDIYIRHLKLKSYQKNLIDIQTKEIWFEAKDGYKTSTYAMFTQLFYYIRQALKEGETIPPFLCVIDTVKAALMKTQIAIDFLNDKSINVKWGKSASDVTPDALEKVSQFIGTHFVSYNIKFNEEEFKEAVHNAIEKGEIIRTKITPDNLKQVFDKWILLIGNEIKDVAPEDFALLFYADIMSDGTVSTHENLPAELIHKGNKPAFLLNGKLYEIKSVEGYRKFWAIYDRPPKEEYRNYLLERRDSLIPTDERSFKGAYFTPLHVVEKAYELLNKTLGDNWQRNYIVWDMCCGVGNLETKHSNHRNIFMSTLDQADIDVMKASKTCSAAIRFQYDYLNDDITDDGKIDYSLTNKIPQSLQKIIAEAKEGKKKVLVLINPPYAEATNVTNTGKGNKIENKTGVAKTKFGQLGMSEFGKASNELFTQFVARISKEIPNATLAMFSTLKYVNGQTMEDFRNEWKADFLDGFVFHSKAFDGVNGNFSIGFLIWKTKNSHTDSILLTQNQLKEKSSNFVSSLEDTNPCDNKNNFPTEIQCEVLDKNANPIGSKTFYNLPIENYLSSWIKRPKAGQTECVPLTNATTPVQSSRRDLRGTHLADDSIGYMCSGTNDVQNAGKFTYILSSGASRGHGVFITKENLWQISIVFTVQRIIDHTWLNDRDQFLKPSKDLSKEFKNDCLIWMLFSVKNLTASADDLEWNGKKWSIVNHFIPFTEQEVGSDDRFESDVLVQYVEEMSCGFDKLNHHKNELPERFSVFSQESQKVLLEGLKLWKKYFETSFDYNIREKYKLNRCDVGWYQIRMAMNDYNETGDAIPISFTAFEEAYKSLTEKLRPKVYEYGFLK